MVRDAQVRPQNYVDRSVVLGTQTYDVDVSSWWIFVIPGQRRRKYVSPVFEDSHMRGGAMCDFLDVVGIKATASVWIMSIMHQSDSLDDAVLTPSVKHVMSFVKYNAKPDLTRVHEHRALLCLRVGKQLILDTRSRLNRH